MDGWLGFNGILSTCGSVVAISCLKKGQWRVQKRLGMHLG